MSTQTITTKRLKLMNPISVYQVLSWYQEIGMFNQSKQVLYACDCNGGCITINPSPGPYDVYHPSLIIYSRQSTGEARVFNTFQSEMAPKTGFATDAIEIKIAELIEHGWAYVKQLDLTIGVSQYEVMRNHPKMDSNLERRYESLNKTAQACAGNAPIKIIVNDPKGRTNTLFTHWGEHIVSIKVTNLPELDAFCKVYICTQQGEYSEYAFDLDPILDGTNTECVTPQGVLCIAPTKEHVALYLHKKKHTTECLFSKDDVTKTVEKQTQRLVDDLNDTKTTIYRLEQENTRLKSDCKSYSETITSLTSRIQAFEIERYENNKRTISLNDTTRKAEHDKYIADRREQKERLSVQAEKTSLVGTILKTVAIVAPIVLSVVLIAKKWADRKEDKSDVLSSIASVITSPIRCLTNLLWRWCQ